MAKYAFFDSAYLGKYLHQYREKVSESQYCIKQVYLNLPLHVGREPRGAVDTGY